VEGRAAAKIIVDHLIVLRVPQAVVVKSSAPAANPSVAPGHRAVVSHQGAGHVVIVCAGDEQNRVGRDGLRSRAAPVAHNPVESTVEHVVAGQSAAGQLHVGGRDRAVDVEGAAVQGDKANQIGG